MAPWTENGPCYVIGEIGSNHNASLRQARKLIEVAAHAKVDAVKVQLIDPFRREWLPHLFDYALENGLDFLGTPFSASAVEYLDKLDVPAIKIASPELVNLELIAAAVLTRRRLILSTGMATVGDIEKALDVARYGSLPRSEVALLQCTTRYPAPYDQANLYAMDTMRDAFGVPVGLSDHTLGIAVPIAAAALRASIIEKHFTLDRNLEGPDHNYALEPDELRAMVQGIRQAEQALGDGRKGPQQGELVEARGRTIEWTT